MSFRNIDITSGETARAILKELEKFTAGVMRPAGIELDDCSDPSAVFADTSSVWAVFAAFRALDLHLVNISEDLGGFGELDAVTAAMIAERLGYADVGLAIGLTAASAPFRLASQMKKPALEALARRFCEDRQGAMIGCRALSPWPDRTVSVREVDDGFLLSGRLPGVVNAAIATHGAFDVNIVSGDHSKRPGLVIMPLDDPNISREMPSAVSSQRSYPRGTLVFADARIPAEYVVSDNDLPLSDIRTPFLIGMNRFLAAVYAGLSRAALDEALEYAKNRVQGGVPIFEHRNIRLQLFHMFKMIEAVRADVLGLAACHDQQGTSRTWPHTVAARCLAVETACHVSSEAIQIFGGYGLAREFPLEKFFRDARLGQVEDGVGEELAIEAMLQV